MSQFYSDPSRASDKYALPDCEVFYVEAGEWWYDKNGERVDAPTHDCVPCGEDSSREECPEHRDYEPCAEGFYYWFCFPGCMPDSDPIGPFDSEDEAVEDCRDQFEED